ncbi:UNVERIFIED_CONTAM: hypothetical protein HDU68_001290 [Siphonaria sp. JEL0065]|nr:hypothetical protein HDU68_001290 [Siphonaria sp. JEL0065]
MQLLPLLPILPPPRGRSAFGLGGGGGVCGRPIEEGVVSEFKFGPPIPMLEYSFPEPPPPADEEAVDLIFVFKEKFRWVDDVERDPGFERNAEPSGIVGWDAVVVVVAGVGVVDDVDMVDWCGC